MSTSLLQSTLFLLVPLFALALFVLALSHSPGPLNPPAILAYTYIASVTLLSTLAGALSLSHSSTSLSQSLIHALLFFLIAIPALHLPPRYVPHLSIGKRHTSVLVITLSIATLIALISPFLPTATPLLYISPSLFLLYTIQSIPRIAYILHNFLYPEDSLQLHPAIPLTLPSPASTASFPFQKHHKIPSVSTTSTNTVVDRTRIFFPPSPLHQEQEQSDQLRSQIVNSRSRSLLVFILAAQVAALTANACALGITISASHKSTTLRTIQTACIVLALTGSMSAYLLHTYNLHLRQTPTPTHTPTNSNYNNLSTNSLDQSQVIESQHHSNPMLIHLAPPPLPRARRKCPNTGTPIEKNPFSQNDEVNAKAVTATDSDLEEEIQLELDVVMDIGRYPMTLGCLGGRPTTATGSRSGKRTTMAQDSIDLGLALTSSPTCTPVPAALPVPLSFRVSVEEEPECGEVSALEKRDKDKIQEYYLSSSSSTSTGSPSSPFSPFERCETETDPSSPDTPYPNSPRCLSGVNVDANRDDPSSGAININSNTNPSLVGNTNTTIYTHTPIRKRSSFFGWEFAWDQEALERADDAGKLRSVAAGGGGSPVRWKSDVNAQLGACGMLNSSTSDQAKKVQSPLVVNHEENFMDLGGNRESFGPSLSSSKPHSLSSEADVREGRMKRGLSWRSSVCGGVNVSEEKVKRKNMLGLGIGMKPLRLSRSFGGTSNNSGSDGHGTGNGREMGHRAILSGDAGPMCGLSLKRKATVLMNGRRSLVSSVSPSAGSFHAETGDRDTVTATKTTITALVPAATPKKSKKQMKPGHSSAVPDGGATGASPSTESEIDKIDSHSIGFIGESRYLPPGIDELDEKGVDADEEADLQKTPTMKLRTTTRSYSPQSYRSSSPHQQCRETASSEGHYGIINESRRVTTTVNTNPPQQLSPSLTRRGLSLKRSFKMGSTVGRTLGPGLTLSGAGSLPNSTSAYKPIRRRGSEGFGFREEEEKRECEGKEKKGKENSDYEKAGKEVDEDVDVEAGSRPSLTIMDTTTAASTYSTITEQYHQEDGHNSILSTAASRGQSGHTWKPHLFADWFRPSVVSTSKSDGDVVFPEREMTIIAGSVRGNDKDRLSSLPLLLPPQPLLLPPMTPPLQSQSLPPTPTKSRSTFLGKPSIDRFGKRSAPPASPQLPRSSEWAHSMSPTNRLGGAAVSMVELVRSRSHSGSRPPSQPSSRTTTPRPSMRLSAMNMGIVRSAFAGVGARVSARMSTNSASTRGSTSTAAGNAVSRSIGMGADDISGDFMDLRDPFASPPPSSKLNSVFRGGDHGGDLWVSERAVSSLGGSAGVYDDDDSVDVGITRGINSINRGKRRVNMSTWGRLPMPATSPLPGSVPGTSSASVSSLVANRKKAHSHHGERRKHKEKRASKASGAEGSGVLIETNSSLHGYGVACSAGEDADFDVEEALLSQRLLRRLDSVEWE